jgi:hypothetical protein
MLLSPPHKGWAERYWGKVWIGVSADTCSAKSRRIPVKVQPEEVFAPNALDLSQAREAVSASPVYTGSGHSTGQLVATACHQ